mgnify:CR=1 FL=1
MKCPNCNSAELRERWSLSQAPNQFTCDTCGACYRKDGEDLLVVDPVAEDDAQFEQDVLAMLNKMHRNS